ncbi:hypothetical protein RVR_4446 [Actinacidiphila reveromycinica]|uniref:Uncharacterized protein n=1 Tax=Actinacidiphila reveromycinica TaxID=659352 RepID=A0A7U3UTG5_9ACTN|nr:hypothetical protein [Streptomyces sp. SN-593]BBA98311.1 hypothetical protein RVR_4446 [Streptomyces sp. SN-593]
MSAAHLHAVPDPDPEHDGDEHQEPGEQPVPVPALVTPPAVDDQLDTAAVDEEPEREADGDEELGEQPESWMPDLRPYCDVRPLAELGPLAVEVGRHAGPPLLRAVVRLVRAIGRFLRDVGKMIRWYAAGVVVLLVLLAGWLSGSFGKRGSVGARFAGAGLAAYAIAKTCTQFPAAPWITLALVIVIVAMASAGQISVPEKKAKGKKGDGKKGATERGGKKTSAKSKATADEGEEETAPEADEEAAPAESRRGLRALLGARLKSTPAEPSPEDEKEAPEEAAIEPPEEAEEAPAAPSREDVIRALHDLYRGGSGVLSTALAQRLQLPHTRALREVLTAAGITPRPGVRTPAGNGPGVHRDDIPPLPSSERGPQGSGVVAGQTANANANNAGSGPEEGLGVEGNVWTSEELAQGYRWVQDPSKPCAWQIEHHPDHAAGKK